MPGTVMTSACTMSMMTEDGVFEASTGDDVNGERHQGPRAVRAAYEAVFAQYPDARWANARHFVKGKLAVCPSGPSQLNDGRRIKVAGWTCLRSRETAGRSRQLVPKDDPRR